MTGFIAKVPGTIPLEIFLGVDLEWGPLGLVRRTGCCLIWEVLKSGLEIGMKVEDCVAQPCDSLHCHLQLEVATTLVSPGSLKIRWHRLKKMTAYAQAVTQWTPC